jgi:hypothetical protein
MYWSFVAIDGVIKNQLINFSLSIDVPQNTTLLALIPILRNLKPK